MSQTKEKVFDEQLSPIAELLIKKVPTKSCVFFTSQTSSRKADSFSGKRIISILKKDPIVRKAISKAGIEFDDADEEVEKTSCNNLCAKLLTAGFLVKAVEVETAVKRYALAPANNSTFEPDGTYVWIYSGSKTKQLWLSLAFLLTIVGMFLIKVWPIWLKIAVYWISLTLLITQLTLIGVRLVLYCVMWLFGFRGLWLFPNLLSDELGVFDSFQPFFGRGVDMEEIRRQKRRERKARERGLAEPAGEGEVKKDVKNLPKQKSEWNFGAVNFLAMLAIGFVYCYYIGLFAPSLVPDFVASHKELYDYFPAIGPPEPPKTQQKVPVSKVNAEELFDEIHKQTDDDLSADITGNKEAKESIKENDKEEKKAEV